MNYSQVVKADEIIKESIPSTPLLVIMFLFLSMQNNYTRHFVRQSLKNRQKSHLLRIHLIILTSFYVIQNKDTKATAPYGYSNTLIVMSFSKQHIIYYAYLFQKSKCCDMFGMDLYFKIETGSRTGWYISKCIQVYSCNITLWTLNVDFCSNSFHERSALYALLMLTPEERKGGVFTASVGNWAMVTTHMLLFFFQLNLALESYNGLMT